MGEELQEENQESQEQTARRMGRPRIYAEQKPKTKQSNMGRPAKHEEPYRMTSIEMPVELLAWIDSHFRGLEYASRGEWVVAACREKRSRTRKR